MQLFPHTFGFICPLPQANLAPKAGLTGTTSLWLLSSVHVVQSVHWFWWILSLDLLLCWYADCMCLEHCSLFWIHVVRNSPNNFIDPNNIIDITLLLITLLILNRLMTLIIDSSFYFTPFLFFAFAFFFCQETKCFVSCFVPSVW